MDSDVRELATNVLTLAHERRFLAKERALLLAIALDVLRAIRSALCGIDANVSEPLANVVEAFADFVFALAQSRNLIAPCHTSSLARRARLV
jgi:hypothetical protein